MTYVVLATDRVSRKGLGPLKDDDRFQVHRIHDSSSAEFSGVLSTAHALIVRSTTRVDAAMIDAAPELKVVGRAGVGVDNIDMDAASDAGVAVYNAPGGNTIAAAELTMALMLSVVRRVTAADHSVRAGRWDRASFRGVELRGRTLGLIGAGRIGGEVARRCEAFGMTVMAYDPYIDETRAQQLGIRLATVDEVIEEAEVISLHVPLNDETRHLIDSKALGRMKKQAFVINASRGGVIVEADLAAALEEGLIAGAALDVYEDEPLSADSPLRDAPNLVLTPHLGASTEEAQVSVAREVALSVRTALLEGDLSGALNASDLS
jgi:D-3-phosphoglycerate dehydrogenase